MMNLERLRIALMVGLCVGGSRVGAQDFEGGHLVLQAKVETLSLTSNKLAAGIKPDEKVSVTLPGRIYEKPVSIQPVAKTAVHRRTPEETSASDFSAFKASDPAWIASNFTRAEESSVKTNFSDHMIMDRTADLFERYTDKAVVGRITYHGAVILLINYHDWPTRLHPEVYVQEDGQWKRTNRLASDETFDIISAALKSGDIIPRP